MLLQLSLDLLELGSRLQILPPIRNLSKWLPLPFGCLFVHLGFLHKLDDLCAQTTNFGFCTLNLSAFQGLVEDLGRAVWLVGAVIILCRGATRLFR